MDHPRCQMVKRWRAVVGGIFLDAELSPLKPALPSCCLPFRRSGCLSPGESRGTQALPKLHLPEKHTSIRTAPPLSPMPPPGSALDGNYAVSLLPFPAIRLIHFKLPFKKKIRETNVSLYAQFLGNATCTN